MTTTAVRVVRDCQHPHARHEHGTRLGYILDRCRCLPCAAANSDYERLRRRQRAYGRTLAGWVDAEPVRAHVHALQAAGLGWQTISKRAGVHNGAVSKLLYGRRREDGRVEPPTRRINPDMARKLLAVPVPGIDELPGGARVDGTGTTRRLQALVAIG